MRAVVQCVASCSVRAGGQVCGRIEEGLLVYLGVGRADGEEDLRYLADKVLNLRILPDTQGKMNVSVLEAGRALLVVSQFTLYGDARRGRRPSYTEAADPRKAKGFYERFVDRLRGRGLQVETGVFGARMEVSYTNMGPVTILLDSAGSF